MWRTMIPGQAADPMAVSAPICPTKPDVPMPAPSGMLVILNTIVESGPKMAPARVGGIQISGFLTMLGNWSMEVPTP